MENKLDIKDLSKRKIILAAAIIIYGMINIYAVVLSGSIDIRILVSGIVMLAFGVRMMYFTRRTPINSEEEDYFKKEPGKKRIAYTVFIIQMIFLIAMAVLTFISTKTEKALTTIAIAMNIMGLCVIISVYVEKHILRSK